MKEIISCSRRTDIPAFYYNWLQTSLKNQKVTLINSYSNKEYFIDLNPDNVHSIVLWSKNYENIINNPGYLSNYNLYFNFTVTGYSNILEPNVPNYKDTLKQIEQLSKQYSPKQINWRFDPILLVKENTLSNAEIVNQRLNMFEILCKEISNCGVTRCTISFAEIYPKVKVRLEKNNIQYLNLKDEYKLKFTNELVNIASKYNIQIYSCCNEILQNISEIKQSHCVDGELLSKLFNIKCTKSKVSGQRDSCGCTRSKDIGSYIQQCKHGCLYCYANI